MWKRLKFVVYSAMFKVHATKSIIGPAGGVTASHFSRNAFFLSTSVINKIIAPGLNLPFDQTFTESTFFSEHVLLINVWIFNQFPSSLRPKLVVFDWHFVTLFIYFNESFMSPAFFRSTFIAGVWDYLSQWQTYNGDILLIITYTEQKRNMAVKDSALFNMYCIEYVSSIKFSLVAFEKFKKKKNRY